MTNQIEIIKQNIDLKTYIESCGLRTEKHGTKDYKCLCPFHDDKTPSLIITPSKQLWNCPVCNKGGSIIDFVMQYKNIDIKETISLLSSTCTVREPQNLTTKQKNLPVNPANPVILSKERTAQLLEKVVSFYEKTFANNAESKNYLENRGLTDVGLFSKHRLGYATCKLLQALPTEGKILTDLEELGIITKQKTGVYLERFMNCIIFPVFDIDGNIITLYARNISTNTNLRHFYLPNKPKGLWNINIIKTYPEIYLVESIIDALSLETAGITNVISIQGTNGLSDDDIKLFESCEVRKVILLLDGDNAGRKATERLKEKMKSSSISCEVRNLPKDTDPNSFLKENGVEKLIELISNQPEEKNPVNPVNPVIMSKTENGFTIQYGLRKYEIIGLEKSKRKLKATIRLTKNGRIHVDTIDFYSARARRQLCQDICNTFEEIPETIKAEIDRLMLNCERFEPQKVANSAKETKVISTIEQKESEEFGKSDNIAEIILTDYTKCGLVGEENNKLLCYLAMTSRKMKDPLSVLILSSSGAGKTALQDGALSFCPPEDLIKLTALSAKALFYKEQHSLKHKILALEEGVGAEDASYAIRNLISSDGLTSETAMRDPQTGKLTTMENKVEGPTSVFVTTTNPEVDPETKSRFLVTGIDESREQTRAILEFQRKRRSLIGLNDSLEVENIRKKHRNFQRLLKNYKVVNPLVNNLGYDDDRLQGRRAQPQYLNLIDAVAFLNQMKKEVKTNSSTDPTDPTDPTKYIEVDENDIKLANKIAIEVLGKSLDELSIPARNLLELIEKFIDERHSQLKEKNSDELIRKQSITFTRRELREFTGWSKTRVQVHLKELISMEYILMESGRANTLQHYILVYQGEGNKGNRFIPGLKIDKKN